MTILRTEDFSGSGTLSAASDSGSAWITSAGSITKSGGQGIFENNNTTHALESGVSDFAVRVTIATIGGHSDAYYGLCGRLIDVDHYLYAAYNHTYGLVIARNDGGLAAISSFIPATLVNGDILCFMGEGSDLTMLVNEVEVPGIACTSGLFPSATKHGLWCYGVNNTAVRLDNFSISSLGSAVPGGAAAFYSQLRRRN